ncbi:Rhodanese domain protein [Oscillochloris trichoides DG-6]|uniref:Rhodanese domain protein n=1 Tax=Oscillochloris trichoides DG-6 TaxID=765420 RepID=E1IF02_9CHLR|nr:rhodanese-like domain-containing protein [Oscillochloris trichoides]EFO80247.1 Rhodanese domain protein [Oscillochloris trichoides DG-6]
MFRNLFRGNPIPQISVHDLKAKLDARETMVLLDVRDPQEFTGDGHIAGARLIPLPVLANRLGELGKDDPIFCICLSGSRSHVACDLLHRQGFTNVTNVVGGMGAWMRSGLPVKRGPK